MRAVGLMRRIDAMSVRAAARHWARIPPDLAHRLRPGTTRIADAFATLSAVSDSLRINRVTGLGHRGEASEAAIDAIVARYREARVRRFGVWVRPGPQAAVIEPWLVARGFSRRPGHALLVRDCRRSVARIRTRLRIALAGVRERAAAVGILAEAFAMPASRRAWSLAAMAEPGSRHLLAFARGTPVAVASLSIEHGLAWLGGAATRTRWRRRGAQSALIAARLRRAARAGCRWAWSETATPARGRPDGSRRNLLRLGFEQIGVAPLFVWDGR